MFCYKCGTQLSEKAKFCHKCGAKVEHESMKQGAFNMSEPVHESEKPVPVAVLQQKDTESIQMPESVNDCLDNQERFQKFVGNHIRKTTQFQSEEELLTTHVSLEFVKKPLGISLILGILPCIYGCVMGNVKLSDALLVGLVLELVAFAIGYAVAYFKGLIMEGKHASKYQGKFEGNIDTEDLIQFLDEYLTYLSPHFHQWGYITKSAFGVRGLLVNSIENSMREAMKETRICTEFGRKQRQLSVIVLKPDPLNTEVGKMEYFVSAENRFEGGIFSFLALFSHDYGFERYKCVVRTAPILQAAMEYYLKVYRANEDKETMVCSNGTEQIDAMYQGTAESSESIVIEHESISEKNNTENNSYPDMVHSQFGQTVGNEKINGFYGDNIKPYYRQEFDRIASGQKPKFNWAALFLNGWIQLYNGCTGIFCKTFLPLLIAMAAVSVISMVGTLCFNLTVMAFTPILGLAVGLGSVVLGVLNGFKFNKWYYQDVMKNPEKKRSRKGFWVLLASEIAVAIVMTLLPRILFSLSYDSLGVLSEDEFFSEQDVYDDLATAYVNEETHLEEEGDLLWSNEDSSLASIESDMDYRAEYAEKVRELMAEDDTVQFAVINLTGSNVPELVAEHYGYDISVFLWADGEIITLMDQWGYGAGGNLGYEYLPGNNVIRNYNMDQAGAIVYEDYLTIDEDYEVVELYEEGLSTWYFRDFNENGWIDEDEYIEDPIYYYGENEISKEEYISYQINGDFERITGDLSGEQILAQLEENDWSFDLEYDSAMGYYEPIENYRKLDGFYVGNAEQSTLSLGIYTSQEEGEIEIGGADMYVNNGQHYSGSVIPIEKDVYQIMTDTAEEVLLKEADFDDDVVLQLYIDGQYLEQYWMVEHYEH